MTSQETSQLNFRLKETIKTLVNIQNWQKIQMGYIYTQWGGVVLLPSPYKTGSLLTIFLASSRPGPCE
jgi:hypothetical protein